MKLQTSIILYQQLVTIGNKKLVYMVHSDSYGTYNSTTTLRLALNKIIVYSR
jgi:hypothetical protein